MPTTGERALAEAARLEAARVYSNTCPESRSADRAVTAGEADVTAGRPLDSFYGPAPADALRDVIEALSPVRSVPSSAAPARADIEQRIARGWDDTRIAEVLATDVDRVANVRAVMDRAAS